MKTKITLFIICCLSFVSCKTYNAMEKVPLNTAFQKLPNLELKLDEASFIAVAGNNVTNGYITTIFRSDMYNNFVENNGKPVGRIVCRAVSGSSKTRFVGLSILSGLTLCTLNLFGMPFGFTKSKMSIACDIYDENDNLLASYISAEHSVKKYAAMYYGYYDWEIVAPAESFRLCIEDINRMISANYKYLLDNLNKK